MELTLAQTKQILVIIYELSRMPPDEKASLALSSKFRKAIEPLEQFVVDSANATRMYDNVQIKRVL